MYRELFLSAVVAAAWLALVFLTFGVLYGAAGSVIGPARLMSIEALFGGYDLPFGMSIGRLSVWLFGVAMFAAMIPVNYYWLRRLSRSAE